jgi:hypothetical protein
MKKLILLFVVFNFVLLLSSCSANEDITYTLTLRGNGGTPIAQNFIISENGEVPCNLIDYPTRLGYTFWGFIDTQLMIDSTHMRISQFSCGEWKVTEDTTLWAYWTLD